MRTTTKRPDFQLRERVVAPGTFGCVQPGARRLARTFTAGAGLLVSTFVGLACVTAPEGGEARPVRPGAQEDRPSRQQPGADGGVTHMPDGGAGSTPADAGGALEEPDATPGETGIRVVGRQLRVNGKPLVVQGVCWNPVPRGAVHPAGLDFAGFVDGDAKLMAEAGINVVRTYEAITDNAVLDVLWKYGIRVINTVYPWGGDDPTAVDARVAAVQDHPAILMWSIGNEWNYNGLYAGLSHDQALSELNEVAARIRSLDTSHPITTIYGELPSKELIEAMPNVDVWGINSYRGLGFGDLFDVFRQRSDKPMFLAEYGADAYNALTSSVDEESQAQAVRVLTSLLLDHASATHPDGVALGGTVFEWADEWWKDQAGTPDMHDVGGVAPGGGPHPDATFNEEWWGIVDIDRNPRPAYQALKALYTD